MKNLFDIFYSFEIITILNFFLIFSFFIWFDKFYKDNYYTSNYLFISSMSFIFNIFVYLQFFSPINYSIFNMFYSSNHFEYFILFMSLFMFFFFLIISKNTKNSFNNYEFLLILILSFIFGFIIIGSIDFIFIFLVIEIFSILSFTLLMKQKTYFNAESSFKYLIFASVSSIFLLVFFFFITFYTGITNIYFFNLVNFINCYFINFFLFFLIISFIIKYGIFPFHSWLPDVYQSSSLSLFLFFNTFSKIFLIFPFMKIFVSINYDTFIIYFIIFFSLFGVLFSTFMGFQQITFRRLIAYSSISNGAFIFIAFTNINKNVIITIFNYTITYSFIIILIISIFSVYKRKIHNSEVTFISEFSKISNNNNFVSYFISASLFFISGIPPFGLFFPKVFIFKEFFFYHSNFVLISLILFFLTILNIFYYCRIIQYIILFNSEGLFSFLESHKNEDQNSIKWYFIIVFTLGTIIIPFYITNNYEVISNFVY